MKFLSISFLFLTLSCVESYRSKPMPYPLIHRLITFVQGGQLSEYSLNTLFTKKAMCLYGHHKGREYLSKEFHAQQAFGELSFDYTSERGYRGNVYVNNRPLAYLEVECEGRVCSIANLEIKDPKYKISDDILDICSWL